MTSDDVLLRRAEDSDARPAADLWLRSFAAALPCTPVQVCATGQTAPCSQFLTNVRSISAGTQHSLAVLTSGEARAWGSNFLGQLGNGTTTDSSVPVQVSGITNAQTVAGGSFHSMALLTDGTVRTWGRGFSGELGNGTFTSSSVPVQVCATGQTAPCSQFLTTVRSIAGSKGGDHSLALLTDGSIRAWGANGSGQLGNGTTTNSSVPVQVTGLTNATSIAAGGGFSLAALTDGTVRSWGSNSLGELGNGTTTSSTTPVRVCYFGQTAPCSRFLDGVTAITAGSAHAVAIIRPSADLAVAKGATPEPVRPNRNLTYTLTVHNNGPTAADDVVLTDALPSNTRFVSATPSQGSCQTPPVGSTGSVRCSLGTLANSATATTQIVVTVRAARNSTVTNTANVTSSTPDPIQSNNAVTIQTPVA